MIPGLNGIRAIAYLAIFFHHAGYIKSGWLGVQLFFVLSGFLITTVLIKAKPEIRFRQYYVQFISRRFFRIFPLYYFFILLVILFSSIATYQQYKPFLMDKVRENLPYASLFIYNFFASLKKSPEPYFLVHLWSLCVELQFYLIWPIVIYLTSKRYLRHVLLAAILSGPVFRFVFYLAIEHGMMGFFKAPSSLAMYTLPFSHVDAFAFGAYISQFEIKHAKKKMIYVGLIALFAGYLSSYIATGQAGDITEFGYPVTLPIAYQFIWAYTLLNYFFALLIYLVVLDGLWLKLLEWQPLFYLGKISYGLYIFHVPMLWLVARLRDIHGFESITTAEVSILAFLATLLISAFSYRFIDEPILRLKDKLTSCSLPHEIIQNAQVVSK